MSGGMKRRVCDQRRSAGIRRGVEDRLPAWRKEDSAAIVDNGGISACRGPIELRFAGRARQPDAAIVVDHCVARAPEDLSQPSRAAAVITNSCVTAGRRSSDERLSCHRREKGAAAIVNSGVACRAPAETGEAAGRRSRRVRNGGVTPLRSQKRRSCPRHQPDCA